jgi:ABC-type phosphate/phosphonate transport system substrate-binding protein
MPNNLMSAVAFNYTYNKVSMLLQALCVAMLLLLASTQAHAKPEYVVGLTEQDIRIASIEDMELGFNYQLDKLSKEKDFSLKVKIYPNESQLQKLLVEHKVIGYFGTSISLFSNQNLFDPLYLYTPVINDQIKNRYVVLVRKDSGINQISQLKQKNIAYCTADAVGVLFLRLQLKEKGLSNIDSFFNKMVIKKNPNLATSATFFKETDATIVLESDFLIASELNPQLLKQMTSIGTSPEYVTDILAFSYNATSMPEFDIDETVQRVANAATSGLTRNSKYKFMRKIKLEDLNSVRDLFEKTNLVKGKP